VSTEAKEETVQPLTDEQPEQKLTSRFSKAILKELVLILGELRATQESNKVLANTCTDLNHDALAELKQLKEETWCRFCEPPFRPKSYRTISFFIELLPKWHKHFRKS
jgi:hypothetical protein